MVPPEVAERWPALAAFAYRSFIESGRGVVVVRGHLFTFVEADAIDALTVSEKWRASLKTWTSSYDPKREAVVMEEGRIVTYRGRWIHNPAHLHQLALHNRPASGPWL